ncbi:hypothetical protein [Rickettsiella endosymbiont of Miltochrista miniata]|uniref:hypothetical protein n=1 Tax=Rickettsiella endosymbiont of Miltochrista miniata TaxID=3066239 RepID=UPI00313CFE0C
MPFPDALRNFSRDGSFVLTDSQIFLENIRPLEKRINHLKEDRPEITFYQILLSNVQLISGPLPQAEMPEHILSGAAVEHTPRLWRDRFADVAITQMASVNGFNSPWQFRSSAENLKAQLTALKEALLALLSQPDTWHSIKLDRVFFYEDQLINHSVTQSFYNDLLISLAKNDSLKELSIKPFSLTKYRTSLVNFLTQNTELEALHLQISEANRQDWLELSQILAVHLKLKSLNLDNSLLDANAYSALANLLDENYRIKITLPQPTDKSLLKAYEPLNQRLSKTGLVRFKENHLTQDKLLQVAITALESLQKLKSSPIDQIKKQVLLEKQFDFLLTNRGHLAITDGQKESWIENTNVLPRIYRDHKKHLKKESSLVQLNLDALVADRRKTIGYVLLEKALETENREAMEILLRAKANLFESDRYEREPFLVKVLQSKGDIKEPVVEYIRRDQRLMRTASEYLAGYPDLIQIFKELKTHLDEYSSHLVKKDDRSFLVSLANEALRFGRKLSGLQNPSDQRGKECAQIYLELKESLKVINTSPDEVTYGALREVQIIMQRIKADSMEALRGFWNTSYLHENVIAIVNRFDEGLEASKKDINDKKDEKINQLHDSLGRERVEAQEIQAKLETENAELRAKQSEMEATLNNLLKQRASNSGGTSRTSTSQNQERPGTSTGLFARR